VDSKFIVFFDGYCGLCNGFVDFLLACNKNIYFSPLQGETAKRMQIKVNNKSIIFLCNGKLYKESEAIINIFISMGGIWKFAMIAKIVPVILRDLVYKFIATNRYKWFGKKENCRVPTNGEKKFFLP
jgi:predicted DCC family thiol-disulfide oxidoreductase YuxK